MKALLRRCPGAADEISEALIPPKPRLVPADDDPYPRARELIGLYLEGARLPAEHPRYAPGLPALLITKVHGAGFSRQRQRQLTF
jgi:hypothetical protein